MPLLWFREKTLFFSVTAAAGVLSPVRYKKNCRLNARGVLKLRFLTWINFILSYTHKVCTLADTEAGVNLSCLFITFKVTVSRWITTLRNASVTMHTAQTCTHLLRVDFNGKYTLNIGIFCLRFWKSLNSLMIFVALSH